MFSWIKTKTSIPFDLESPPKKRKLPPFAHEFKHAAELLSPHKRYLKNIKMDVGAKDDFFERYYQVAIDRFAEAMQLRPYGQQGEYAREGGAIELAIKRLEMSLKLRLGLLLPRNVPAEDIAERKECWTYGVFVTALLREMGGQLLNTEVLGFNTNDKIQGVWVSWLHGLDYHSYYKMRVNEQVARSLSQSSSILQLHHIIPECGLLWMYNDPPLLDDVLGVLSGSPSRSNMIYSLIVDATEKAVNGESLIFELPENPTPESVTPAPKPKPKLEPKPKSKPKPKPKPEPEPKPKPKPKLKPKPEPEPKPKLKPKPEPEPLSLPSSASAPDVGIETINMSLSFGTEEVEPLPEFSVPLSEEERFSDPDFDMPIKVETPPVNSQKPEPETVEEAVPTTETFAAFVVKDLKNGTHAAADVMMDGDCVLIRYPAVFKRYTDSPSNLLNDLKMTGRASERSKQKTTGPGRMIACRI